MRTFTALLATVAIGVFTVGCGDDDDSGTATPPATPPPAETTAAEPASGDIAISMKDIAFDPADVTAKVGQKVVWTNDDSVDHNVVAKAGEDFKSDTFGKGGTYSYTLDEAGTIDYVCTLHPGMDGKIVVTE
jgi:plastocyanin